jgi:hypothetical protein
MMSTRDYRIVSLEELDAAARMDSCANRSGVDRLPALYTDVLRGDATLEGFSHDDSLRIVMGVLGVSNAQLTKHDDSSEVQALTEKGDLTLFIAKLVFSTVMTASVAVFLWLIGPRP